MGNEWYSGINGKHINIYIVIRHYGTWKNLLFYTLYVSILRLKKLNIGNISNLNFPVTCDQYFVKITVFFHFYSSVCRPYRWPNYRSSPIRTVRLTTLILASLEYVRSIRRGAAWVYARLIGFCQDTVFFIRETKYWIHF